MAFVTATYKGEKVYVARDGDVLLLTVEPSPLFPSTAEQVAAQAEAEGSLTNVKAHFDV